LNRPQSLHWLSVGQLTLGLLATAAFWVTAFGALAAGGVGLISGSAEFGDSISTFLLGVPLAACGFLMLPSVYYPLLRILGKPSFNSIALLSKLKPGWWILALPPVIGLGHLVVTYDLLPWLLLPPLHLLAVGIPTAWMLFLALRGLPTSSSQRLWGLFGGGVSLAPFLIMALEILAGAGILILFVIYLATQPELAEKTLQLAAQLREAKTQAAMLRILKPVISNPLVVASVIAFGALIVPLIEELIKPIGAWFLVGRKVTPAAGFAAGALSGAGYGFIESLLLSGNATSWAALVTARIGTTAVHIFTAGLVGWALVQTWQRRRFLRLALAYLGAVLIHGLWNGLTLAISLQMLAQAEDFSLTVSSITPLGIIAPIGIAILALACLLGLIIANRSLQRKRDQPQPWLEQTGESLP